jgi:hypothetical protein
MNEMSTLTLDNLMAMSMPKELDYSSNSLVDESDKITQQIITERFDVVKSNIGEELFNQLSYDDRMLMVNTAGTIDFGRAIDLDKVEKDIENYDYSN